jgi:uncharacterized repeat protein (TIGR03803 family)
MMQEDLRIPVDVLRAGSSNSMRVRRARFAMMNEIAIQCLTEGSTERRILCHRRVLVNVTMFARLALICTVATTMYAQSYKVLVNFEGEPSQPVQPGIIAQNRGGSLLSTSLGEAFDQHGNAFRVKTSGTVTLLHEFNTPVNGKVPPGGLTLGMNGRFFGTTMFGGANNSGTIFEMTPNGTIKTLHDFAGAADGNPQAPPIQSLSGDFYGTTYGNDRDPNGPPGTVYRINSSGNYTLLHTFNSQDGANPLAPLVQDPTNFWFYGTAEHGASNLRGSIFRISNGGEFEVLYKFDLTHGRFPVALIQASDGNFYGMARAGGSYDAGVIFRMTPSHQVTVLHTFTGGSDGQEPLGGFLQGSDGYLYGTAAQGGASGSGVLFRISTTGEFKVLHNFQGKDGSNPVGLIQHTNGLLYGDTAFGGLKGGGVFFRYDLGLSPFVSYLPTYGRVGMPVDILGSGFTTFSQAFFNGMRAQIITVFPNYMRVVVPHGATSGWITVTTTKGTLKSNKKFLVHP